MRSIYRYALDPRTASYDNRFSVELPQGAEILSVGPPRRDPDDPIDLWALVDPSAPMETRRLWVHGTGHDVAVLPGRFVGTVQLYGGSLIFHVFEETN